MGPHTVRHDCSNLAHTQTPTKQQSAQLLGYPPVKRGARRDAGTPGGEVSLSVHGGSWADVTSPSPRRSSHRPEGTFWASAAALTYGRGAGSSVSSQHLQLGLRPCSAPSRGTTTRRTTTAGTASPHPGCDNLRVSGLILPPASLAVSRTNYRSNPPAAASEATPSSLFSLAFRL